MKIMGAHAVNNLYVTEIMNDQAQSVDPITGAYTGYGKAVDEGYDIVIKRGNKHTSVVTGEVYDPTARDKDGSPQLRFVAEETPFGEFFPNCKKKWLSTKKLRETHAKLNGKEAAKSSSAEQGM